MDKPGMETYLGLIRTPSDAIILFEACRLGLLPRVCRRLSEKERQQIRSGSVFVWDEREAGMRRWTDGKSWSASRVSGSFLTYREMEGKRSGGTGSFAPRSGRTPDGSRNSDDGEQNNDESQDGYRYKPDGLMKQSFSITTSTGQHLHLISYFSRILQHQQKLMQPTQDPALRNLKPQPGMYPESSVQDSHNMPAVTRSPMPPAGPPSQAPAGPGYARQGRGFPPSHPPSGPPSAHPGFPPPGYPAPPPIAVNGYGHPQYSPLPSHPYAAYGPPPPGQAPHLQQSSAAYSQPPPGQLLPLNRNNTPPSDNRSIHQRTGSSGSYAAPSQYYPSPHAAYVPLTPQGTISSHPSQTNSPASTPPGGKLDARVIVAPSPLSQTSPHTLHPNHIPPPAPRRSISPHHSSPIRLAPRIQPGFSNHASGGPQLPPTSAPAQSGQGASIPSIHSLVNGANQYEHSRSPSGSRSPGGPYQRPEDGIDGQGPRDIPHDKLKFGEDRRALNVLNKAFRT